MQNRALDEGNFEFFKKAMEMDLEAVEGILDKEANLIRETRLKPLEE